MCRRATRREPLVITLGTAAYGAYQQHHAKRDAEQKALEEAPADNYVPKQSLAEAMHGLELEKQGIPPPTYEEVIANRAIIDNEQTVQFSDEESEDSLDDMTLSQTSGVARTGSRKDMKAAWKLQKRQAREARMVEKAKRRAEKRAARVEWWEEKKAARAERIARARGGRCC
jgi:hypothetical protein